MELSFEDASLKLKKDIYIDSKVKVTDGPLGLVEIGYFSILSQIILYLLICLVSWALYQTFLKSKLTQ